MPAQGVAAINTADCRQGAISHPGEGPFFRGTGSGKESPAWARAIGMSGARKGCEEAEIVKKTIFVIDDDPDILDSISAILSAEGFAVETAMSGDEGIEKLP